VVFWGFVLVNCSRLLAIELVAVVESTRADEISLVFLAVLMLPIDQVDVHVHIMIIQLQSRSSGDDVTDESLSTEGRGRIQVQWNLLDSMIVCVFNACTVIIQGLSRLQLEAAS
jgi:hypothetical protein